MGPTEIEIILSDHSGFPRGGNEKCPV
jgi:hypothetical protein